MRQSLQKILSLSILATICALCSASCNNRVVTPKSYSPNSTPLLGKTRWEVTQHGEFETLEAEWTTTHGKVRVHTLGLESCDIPLQKERRDALVRQMFSGFSSVHIEEIEEIHEQSLEISLAKVRAELDNLQVQTILLSAVRDGCLYEQAFWSDSDPSWIEDPDLKDLLIAELMQLPPWNTFLQTEEKL